MKHLALSVLLFCSSLLFAQNWTWQNPLPQGNRLWDVSPYGWAVGEGGTIVNGAILEPSPLRASYTAVAQPGPGDLWVVTGNPGGIYHSANDGENWACQWFDSMGWLGDISFPMDAQHGWALGAHGNGTRFVLRTADGGSTWTELNDTLFACARSLRFADNQHGMLGTYCGQNAITADAGQTWSLISVGCGLWNVFFLTNTIGWGTDLQSVWHTTDGGTTWTPQNSSQIEYVVDLAFADANHGWGAGRGGIVATTDGGEHWTLACADSNGELNAISAHTGPGGLSVRAVGDYGTILTSSDGVVWNRQTGNVANRCLLSSVCFAGPRMAWAVGGSWGSPQSQILCGRSDGSAWHWDTFELPDGGRLSDIATVDTLTAFAVGSGGGIYVTTDGGAGWQRQTSPVTWDLLRVCFVDRDHGFALRPSGYEGGEGQLLKTADGGQLWTAQSFTAVQQTFDMDFTDAQNGWLVGGFADEGCGYGFVMHTTDGGESWTQQFYSPDTCIWVCDFVDNLTGWAGGSPGVILKTTDGGASWQPQATGTPGDVGHIRFADTVHGLCLLGGGLYLRTADGGSTWQTLSIPCEDPLQDLAMLDSTTALAVGINGEILSYGEALHSASPRPAPRPLAFSLSAYPNPFNPNTTLSFDLPQRGHATLAVYDLEGRLVQTLADQVFPQGSYRIAFDGARLPSGIYFARMQGNSFVKTQKLILLK